MPDEDMVCNEKQLEKSRDRDISRFFSKFMTSLSCRRASAFRSFLLQPLWSPRCGRRASAFASGNAGTSRRGYSAKADTVPLPSTAVLPKPRLDYRSISENVVYKSHNAFNRKAPLTTGAIQSVARAYKEHKDISSALNAMRNARSIVGEQIRKSMADGAEAQAELMREAKVVKQEITELEILLQDLEEQLLSLALSIPNDTHPLSPLGPETAAVTLSTHGPPPIPASPARDHVSIGRALNLFDFQAGATVTGNSWYYLMNEGALLEMALTNYALSVAIKHGFTPVTTPDVVHSDIARRCGFQPRDHSDPLVSQMYHITGSAPGHPHTDLVLSGTAEIPLAGLFANKIIATPILPLKVVGLGRAFRAEAGARGADTRGLYRVHQFTKVELFAVTQEDGSEEMMEEMRNVQQKIFEGLGLSFR